MKKYITTILLITLGAINSYAQIEGSWKGTLDVQGTKLDLIFNVENKDGKITSTMDSPSQGAMGIAMDKTSFENNVLEIAFTQAGIKYKGKLENKVVNGTFYQGGMEFPLHLKKTIVEKPGNVSLPSSDSALAKLAGFDKANYKYKVEDYFQKPKASGFQMSPEGKYLSYQEKDKDGKNHLYVKNTTNGEINRAIEEKEELIKGYGWINDSRLIYVMDKGGDENYHIYAVNIDGTNSVDLTPFEGVKANFLNRLREQKDFIIVSMNKENLKVFEPYKVNVNTGALEKLFTNTDVKNPVEGYEFDKDGVLRGYTKIVNGLENHIFHKPEGAKDFELLFQLDWKSTFRILSFNYASKNKDEAYVLTNLDSDKSRIVLYDLKKKKVIKEIYSNKTYDVTSIALSRKRNYEIDYLGYYGEKQVIEPVSKTYKDLNAIWTKEFKGNQFSIADVTENEDKYLLVVSSDKVYSRYYEYNAKTKKASLLFDLMPQLNEKDMAEVRPITFKSRDGLTLHGYITLPKEALNGKKVPLIVNPHGGPQGVRDYWGFNPETQLFASRGYATLQVNFRISGGYGKEFLEAGFKQIGRKAMDDVEDGVRYVIEQGLVDENNVAIYGASHGGYATLMGLIKTPDLYKCGVDYVGVSNLETFFSTFPAYWEKYRAMMYEIWYNMEDAKELEIAKEVSPINNLDKINKPLFVVQGANDPRVNINEADQIVTAMRAKGFEVPYMVKYNEGHGFYHEENSIALYKTMLGFFAQNLK
jgi:dipeptidyl aminopeptidase/acylaminoacyl peptidase